MPGKQQSLFHPFRALGYITDDVPFAVNRLGKESFVTVSVGKAWQIYNCAKLTLVLVGPEFKSDIRALACKVRGTFPALARGVGTGARRVLPTPVRRWLPWPPVRRNRTWWLPRRGCEGAGP